MYETVQAAAPARSKSNQHAVECTTSFCWLFVHCYATENKPYFKAAIYKTVSRVSAVTCVR